MLDDGALLQRFSAQHAQDAFAEVVRRHIDAVYSAALRRVGGDRHLAEDVTQQVFVALARKAAVVSRHPLLSGWLFTATRNEAANAVRTERRRKAREMEAQAMREILPEPESEADWSRVAPVLDTAIDELNDRDRTAILLRFIERRSFPEIGAVLRLSDDAARMRVDRALDKLRTLLARRGITSTSAALGVALASHVVTAAPATLAGAVTGAAAAAAPVALASAFSFLELMSTTKFIAAATGLVVIAAVGTATREVLLAHESQTALVAARTETDALAAQVRRADQAAAKVADDVAQLEKTLADERSLPPAPPTPARQASPPAPATMAGNPPEAIAAGEAFQERHPEVKQLIREYCRAQLAGTLGAFFRSRNLSPEQIAEFEKWMMMDSGVIRRMPGADGQLMILAGPDFGNREKRRAMEESLLLPLGPEGVQQLRDCFQQLPGRRLATQLGGALCFTETPLAKEQVDQLVRAVAETTAGPGRGWNGTFNWAGLLPKAQAFLSPTQIAMLRSLQAQEQYQFAMNQALRRGTAPKN